MKKQKGQIVLILLLVMVVALAIGLSVVQRSLTDITSSSKVEQSSRAFSAAEAGVEKALSGSTTTSPFTLDNSSTATVSDSGLLPNDKQALEYPPISKEEVAQVWLADPGLVGDVSAPVKYYDQNSLDIYWGLPNPSLSDIKPALEVTVVYLSGGNYLSKRFYFDPDSDRASKTNFTSKGGDFQCDNYSINTSFSVLQSSGRQFYCKARLSGLTPTLILLRARILYSNFSQPFAVQPLASSTPCASDNHNCSLPKQAKVILSKGFSGDTTRSVQVFKINKVVPFYFDYAIFSSGSITKN